MSDKMINYFNDNARYIKQTGRYVIRFPQYSASGLMADADLDKLFSKFKRKWKEENDK